MKLLDRYFCVLYCSSLHLTLERGNFWI